MGNYNTRSVRFLQSRKDFPQFVSLGKRRPSFGLYRFDKPLRFVPPDDEGFTMRGDRRRLLYKGRRRSHRFTILGDTAFEYDCILEKPPDSNVISLFMEGAENYDFFRQPDFVTEPFLKGSYAVYKKETLIGEGTGKLCHIHRPEIIDARWRRCWGDLAVANNELRITIPEKWLGEAVYPVIVDPTIGTATVGSQYQYLDYGYYSPLCMECTMAVNRFYVSETVSGLCTAYIYASDDVYDYGEAGGMAVIFNESNNKPYSRLSTQENFINFDVNGSNPRGWRSGTFRSNGNIVGGSNIWFGVAPQFFWWPRFDYGSRTVIGDWDPWENLPATFPGSTWEDDYKLSMYFTYTSAQNYVRTLTQGVNLTDTPSLKADYKKSLAQTAGVNSLLGRFEGFYRNCVMTVHNTVNVGRFPDFFRTIAETINAKTGISENRSLARECADNVNAGTETNRIHDAIRKAEESGSVNDVTGKFQDFYRNCKTTVSVNAILDRITALYRKCEITAHNFMTVVRLPDFYRTVTEIIKATSLKCENLAYSRKCEDGIDISSQSSRILFVFRTAQDIVSGSDGNSYSILFLRSVTEYATVSQINSRLGIFFRGLAVNAGSVAETTHKAEYYRFHADTVKAAGVALRSLLLFVRLVSKVFVRDYLLGRFLKAREEIVLKSAVCREIILDSEIG